MRIGAEPLLINDKGFTPSETISSSEVADYISSVSKNKKRKFLQFQMKIVPQLQKKIQDLENLLQEQSNMIVKLQKKMDDDDDN